MGKVNYKEILLRTAVCAIACDGDIDEREKEALYRIEKNSPYFCAEDLSNNLDIMLEECMGNFQLFLDELLESIDKVTLNIVQELTLLEISLRIIAADDIELDSEKEFIINLRGHLKLDNDVLTERFGIIDYLNKEESEFKQFDKKPNIETHEIKKKK